MATFRVALIDRSSIAGAVPPGAPGAGGILQENNCGLQQTLKQRSRVGRSLFPSQPQADAPGSATQSGLARYAPQVATPEVCPRSGVTGRRPAAQRSTVAVKRALPQCGCALPVALPVWHGNPCVLQDQRGRRERSPHVQLRGPTPRDHLILYVHYPQNI